MDNSGLAYFLFILELLSRYLDYYPGEKKDYDQENNGTLKFKII